MRYCSLPVTSLKLSRSIGWASWAGYFLLFSSYAVLSPYLQVYLKLRGFSPANIGLLLGCLELAGMAGPMLLGRIADERNVFRRLLAAGLVVPAVLFLPMQASSRFAVFLLAMILMGFTYRSTVPLLDSIASRALADPNRQYGPLRTAGSLGFVATSLVLQLAGQAVGGSATAIAISFAVTAGCAAAASAFLPKVRLPARAAPAADRRTGHDGFDLEFWIIIAVIFLGRFGIGSYYSFFSLYLQSRFPTAGISLFWAIGSLAEIATIFFSGKLIQRFGIRVLFAASLAAVSIRLCIFVVSPSIVVVAVSQLLHALTFGTFHTASVAYVNKKIPVAKRGMGMAIYNAVGIGLPSFGASVIGGYVLQAHGFEALFLSYAAVPMLGILLLLVRRSRRPSANA